MKQTKRSALSNLVEWKQKKDRKPLIIRGARQVGKTWLMKEFAQLEFKQCAYINVESSPHLKIFLQISILSVSWGINYLPTHGSIPYSTY